MVVRSRGGGGARRVLVRGKSFRTPCVPKPLHRRSLDGSRFGARDPRSAQCLVLNSFQNEFHGPVLANHGLAAERPQGMSDPLATLSG